MPSALHATANARDAWHGPLPTVTLRTATPRRPWQSAETRRHSMAPFRLPSGSGPPQATREASSTQTRAHSRPAPWRWPARVPVARHPGPSKRPIFLTPVRVMPPGRSCR